MESQFAALVVSEENGIYTKEIQNVSLPGLSQNELIVKVSFSSINYKDLLSASGNKGVTKNYPHVPGVDAVGTVTESKSPHYKEGDEIIVTGYDLGMNTWGGFGQYIKVPDSWAVSLPASLSQREAMIYGTAGLTAGLSIQHLLKNEAIAHSGSIVVSGATGGVGSIAIAILNKLGYQTTAISGKKEDAFLTQIIQPTEVISRSEFELQYNQKPISKPVFAGGIDAVGGNILSGILKSTQYNGTVTCCGMVASPELNTSIFPFILRGVQLIGIDSVEQPLQVKSDVWNLLGTSFKPDNLNDIVTEISLPQLASTLDEMQAGRTKGRILLNHAL